MRRIAYLAVVLYFAAFGCSHHKQFEVGDKRWHFLTVEHVFGPNVTTVVSEDIVYDDEGYALFDEDGQPLPGKAKHVRTGFGRGGGHSFLRSASEAYAGHEVGEGYGESGYHDSSDNSVRFTDRSRQNIGQRQEQTGPGNNNGPMQPPMPPGD